MSDVFISTCYSNAKFAIEHISLSTNYFHFMYVLVAMAFSLVTFLAVSTNPRLYTIAFNSHASLLIAASE